MSKQKDTDFTNDVIEKLLLKKIYTDVSYTAIFQDIFDSRWCENDSNSILIKLIIAFYKQYERLPNQKIVSAMLMKYAEKHTNIDYDTIIKHFIEVRSFDLDLTEDCCKENLKRFMHNRGLYFAIFDNINDIEKNKSIDKCLQRFEKIQSVTFDDNLGLDYFNDMDKHWNYMLNPEARISVGWPSLDRITYGGFLSEGRSLYIFMGQPGLGKSTVLSNITHQLLKQEKTVVVISLEMSQDVYAARFDAHISEDNINHLRQTATSSREKIQTFFKDHPNANLFIKEYPPRTIRPSDIEIYLDKLIAKGVKIDAIVIDYLNLVNPQTSRDSSNSYSDVLAVSEKLRALSYKYLAPVITATQANTEGFNNADIGMEHISESRGIAHVGDFIAALYQLDDDLENGIINMKILKNRLGGKIGKVLNFKLNPDTLVLDDISITSFSSNDSSNREGDTDIVENLDPLDSIANDLKDL